MKEIGVGILYATVQALVPKTEYEEFCRIVDKREAGYEECCSRK